MPAPHIRGSIREVRAMVARAAYLKIKPLVAGKDWQIVGFSEKSIILRIERTNFQLSRSTGKVEARVDISSSSARKGRD